MAFDWNLYLIFSRKLFNASRGKTSPINEAVKRSAISRAYYSVFNLAKIHAQSTGYISPSVDHHTDLFLFYRRQMDSVVNQEVGTTLSRLHRNRKKSDYDDSDLGDLDKLVESCLIEAERIKTLIST